MNLPATIASLRSHRNKLAEYNRTIANVVLQTNKVLAKIEANITELDVLLEPPNYIEPDENPLPPTPPVTARPRTLKVAIVVGHEPTSPGACNAKSKLCEFEFNDDIADRMIAQQPARVELVKVHRHPGSYSQLPAKVNALGPDLVLSLHANAFNGEASGTTMLYASGSSLGRQFAGMLQARVLNALDLVDRGLTMRTRQDRGGTLLFGTKAPAVIVEPFFIDNDDDLARAQGRLDRLIAAYLDAIEAYRDARQING